MTRDTDDGSDPYKIIISIEDDEGNHRKQFFEKGLSALLADPHFLLLYVPDGEAKMQIIRPASDSYHRKRMIQRVNEAKRLPSFYYALSHLWGLSESNPEHWNDISEYVDDENGQPVDPVSMRPEKRGTLLTMLKDHPDSYWWIDVLCARTDTPLDIMGDIYAYCLECIAIIDCEPRLIPELRAMMDDYEKKCPQLMDLFYTLLQSRWWTRVWTWQEMALPFGDVRLMAETDTHRLESNTITVDNLIECFINALGVINTPPVEYPSLMAYWDDLVDRCHEINQARTFNKRRIEIKTKSARHFYHLIESLGNSSRRCMDPVDYVYGVLGIFQFKIPRMTDPSAIWQRFLTELEIYLVDITNEEFQLPGYKAEIAGLDGHARHVDLQKAKDMSDVYKGLLAMA